MKFAQQRRFTPEQEAEICRLYATGQHSQHALARMNGCSQGTIARILKAKPEMNVAALQRRVAELEAALAEAADNIRYGAQKARTISFATILFDAEKNARAALVGEKKDE